MQAKNMLKRIEKAEAAQKEADASKGEQQKTEELRNFCYWHIKVAENPEGFDCTAHLHEQRYLSCGFEDAETAEKNCQDYKASEHLLLQKNEGKREPDFWHAEDCCDEHGYPLCDSNGTIARFKRFEDARHTARLHNREQLSVFCSKLLRELEEGLEKGKK